MANKLSTRKVMKMVGRTPEPKTPVANEMFLPNLSGIASHPEALNTFASKQRSVSITIEDPTDAEDFMIIRAGFPLTVASIIGTVRGSSPSVTVNIKHASDRTGAGTSLLSAAAAVTSTTFGDTLTLSSTQADKEVGLAEMIWLETTAQSGTVDELNITIFFLED